MVVKNRSIPEASIDTRLVYQRIMLMIPGELIYYDELRKILQRDPQSGKGYSSVMSARKMAEREGFRFAAVAGVGIKRLTDSEIAMSGSHWVGRTRRAAKTGTRKLLGVRDFDALTREEKIAHNTSLSILGAIQQSASAKTVGRIEKEVAKTLQAIPLAATLKLFGG